MKTSVESLDPVKVKLTVEVEPKRVKQAFDRAARELAKQVSLPGFRPGKAPRRLLEQRFGEGVIAQTAMENSLSDYYVEALRSEEIDAVAQPEVDVETFDEAEGCTFTATIEVRPSFDPPAHDGISVTFPEWDVDDEDVDEQLEQLRERFAEVDEVERAAQDGDLATLDLRVEVEGSELESARVEDALYEIGSQGVTPKLDEELVGKSAGDEFSYEDALPEEYPEHGGEQATFFVTVKDVREKTLPELDDDFAQTASGFDTLDELKRDLRNSLLRRRVEQAQHELRGRILEAYLARVDVPLPPSMVEADKQGRIHQLEHQAERFGIEVDQLFAMEETSREEFEANAQTQAEETVKAQLVLDALSSTLELDLQPGDIDQEIVRHAQSNGVSPQEIARVIQQQGSLPALVGDILRRKTIDAIVASAQVEGGPSDEVLIELGLLDDPDATEAGDTPDAEGERSDAEVADTPDAAAAEVDTEAAADEDADGARS
ncbi:trigger factor [Egicoccus halophilus]|uniref:Trigger factor n=1 Tax=Egicoccus halophilus TaxID=1670830 RepID=A0A8J3A8R3_9ACTN|nr:trigger factor [Egicoccus halophilus]GGI06779.1 trigger factor [Egicoccus halophilus]